IFQDPVYIPLVNDPNVSYGGATADQIAAFHAFIDADKYLSKHRGQIASRNDAHYPWVNQLDLGIQQEIPGLFADHKGIVRLDINSCRKMLNDDSDVTWGDTFPDNTRQLARLGGINPDGTYVCVRGRASNPSYQALEKYAFSAAYPSRLVSRWSAMLSLA